MRLLWRLPLLLFAVLLYLRVSFYRITINVASLVTRKLVGLLWLVALLLLVGQLAAPPGVECRDGLAQLIELDAPSLLDAERPSPLARLNSSLPRQATRVHLEEVASNLREEEEAASVAPGAWLATLGRQQAPEAAAAESSQGSGAGGPFPGIVARRRFKRDLAAAKATLALPPAPSSSESYLGRLQRRIKAAILPERNYFTLVRRIHRWFWAFKRLQQAALASGAIKTARKGSDVFKEEFARVDQILLEDAFYLCERDADAELAELTREPAEEKVEESLSASESGSSLSSLDSGDKIIWASDDSDSDSDDDDDEATSSRRTQSDGRLASVDLERRRQEAPKALEVGEPPASEGWLDFDEELAADANEPEYDLKKVESMDFLYRVLSATITRLEAKLEDLKVLVSELELKLSKQGEAQEEEEEAEAEAEAKEAAEAEELLFEIDESASELEKFDEPVEEASPINQEQIERAMARAKRTLTKEAKSFARNELLSVARVAAYKGLALYVSGVTISDPAIASNLIEPLLYLLGGASTPLAVGYLRDVEYRAAIGLVNRIQPIPVVTCGLGEYGRLKATIEQQQRHHLKSE